MQPPYNCFLTDATFGLLKIARALPWDALRSSRWIVHDVITDIGLPNNLQPGGPAEVEAAPRWVRWIPRAIRRVVWPPYQVPAITPIVEYRMHVVSFWSRQRGYFVPVLCMDDEEPDCKQIERLLCETDRI